MYEKEKEKPKRKGRPQNNRLRFLLGAVLCGTMVIVVVVLQWITALTAPRFTLDSFAISESQNQIALTWRSYPDNKLTQILATRRWSDVKEGRDMSNLLSGSGEGIKDLSFQTNGPALLTQLYNNMEIRLDGQTSTRMDRTLTSTLSPSGVWLAQVKNADAMRVMLYRIRQDNGENHLSQEPTSIIDLTEVVESGITALALSADDQTLAVATNARSGMQVTVTLVDIPSSEVLDQFEIAKGQIGHIAMHPEGHELAVGIEGRVYVLTLNTGDVEALSVPYFLIPQFAYDSTGRWLAAAGTVSSSDTFAIYDLTADSNRSGPFVIQAPTTDRIVKFQFLNDGIVIGQQNNQLTYWEWNGETWEHTTTWNVAWD